MKSFVLVFLLISATIAAAQYSRAISLKTDISNPFHIGIDVPLGKALAVDAGVSAFDFPLSTSIGYRTDWRVNLRYYLHPEAKSAFFVSAGLHQRQQYLHNYPKQDNSVEIGSLDLLNLAIGAGIKTRYFGFWLTLEPTLINHGNSYVYKNTYGAPVRQETWKPFAFIGAGISWHMMNITPRRYTNTDNKKAPEQGP